MITHNHDSLIEKGYEFIEVAPISKSCPIWFINKVALRENVSLEMLTAFRTKEKGWGIYFVVGADKTKPYKSEPMLSRNEPITCTNHFSDGSKIFPNRKCNCKEKIN